MLKRERTAHNARWATRPRDVRPARVYAGLSSRKTAIIGVVLGYLEARDKALEAAAQAVYARNQATEHQTRYVAEALRLLAEAVAELASSMHESE